MARPTPPVDADPYTPRHVRDALRLSRRLAPDDVSARDVLLYLAACASRDGSLARAPGIRTLADELAYHPDTIAKALARLERRALIAWHRRPGKRSRIDLLFVIHSARALDPRASVSTARGLSPPRRAGVWDRAEEVLRTEEEPPISIVCRDCGRSAAAGCALADRRLCTLGNPHGARDVGEA